MGDITKYIHEMIEEAGGYEAYMKSREQKLPAMGTLVKAKCKRSDDSIEYHYIRRIKSDNDRGWQWSNSVVKTYFTLEVISWEIANDVCPECGKKHPLVAEFGYCGKCANKNYDITEIQ